MPDRRDPAGSWRRYKDGLRTGCELHALTERVAKAIHEERYADHSWEVDRERDQWLAVGSWQTAEAVVAILPMAVTAGV